FSILAEDSVPYVTGKEYQVKIAVQDTSLQVSIDGSLVFSATDGSFLTGSIALYSWGNSSSYFDDILVEGLSAANQTPVISSVTASPPTIPDDQSSQLQVVASDPDNGPNTPLTYNWIVSSGQGSLDFSNIANPVYTPPDVSGTQIFTLTVEVSDGAAITSETVDITVTDAGAGPQILLSDDFNDGNCDGWTLVDQGTLAGPMAWSAASGIMVQSSNVHSSISVDPVAKLGTYAYWQAGTGWTDYTAAVTIKSTDNDAIGVMFRYQDENNYYRFIWDKERNSRQLVKCDDGVFSILDEDSVPYVTGKEYQVKISAQGSSLYVSIDGALVFSETDSSFSTGSIALYSWGNSSSYFDDIVVEGLFGTNQAPVANAGVDQITLDVDDDNIEQITLDGSGSTDSDGTIQNYLWTEGATILYNGPNPTAQVDLDASVHTITLTVTDDDGATDFDTVVIIIHDDSSVSISGYKFEDINDNGIDDSEPRLANWTIGLYLDDGDGIFNESTPTATTLTSSGGDYLFLNVDIGDYWVREIHQTGWIQTTVDPSLITIQSGDHISEVDDPGLAFGNFEFGSIIYVDDNASGDPGPGDPNVSDPLEDGTNAHPFDSIQEAIDVAIDGDIVIVAEGIYYENIRLDAENIRLTSTTPENPMATIIHGSAGSSVVEFTNGDNSRMIGFGITSSSTTRGITCSNSSPLIEKCEIFENTAYQGAGMYFGGSSRASVVNCVVRNNSDPSTSGGGGGASLRDYADIEFLNCVFYGNSTGDEGGALNSSGNAHSTWTNCTVTGNSASWGPGLSSESHLSITVINSIVAGNNGIGYQIWAGWDEIDYEDVSVWYSNIEGAYPGWPGATQGNIDVDPQFVDTSSNNYHLLQSSLCIDSGDPNSDYSLEPQPNGSRINMGAYGNTPEATTSSQLVYFADPNLKAAVEAQLGMSDPTETDMLGLTALNTEHMGITDLTGLEHAVNLTSLSLYNNQVSNINPLSGLMNLANLNLELNPINDISALVGLTNLVTLYINQNPVSDISVLAGLTNLTVLRLYENQISDISALAGLTNLNELRLFGNQISDISALSGLTNLTFLSLGNNQVSDISVLAGLTNLTGLHLYDNQISDISALSALTNITELHIASNQISDISALAGLTNLEWLELDNNQISDISPISGLTNFTHLDLTVNPLNGDAYNTYIPQILANNPGMTLLYDPPSTVLLSEDFNDGNYDGWSLVDQGTLAGPMAWSAASGTMVQSSNVHSSLLVDPVAKLGTYAYWQAGMGWTDYTAVVTIKSTDNDAIGIMFRYQDEDNYYRFIWDKERNSRQLVKCEDGVFSVLVEDSVPYVTGKEYQVKIAVQGNSLQVSIDGGLVFSATDGSFSTGSIALYSWGNSSSYFDNILVEGSNTTPPPCQLIPIPDRKDHVFDPVYQILYITTQSGTVERYDITTKEFLSPWAIGGTLGGIDVTPNGETVLVSDRSYDTTTNVGYIHRVDALSGIVTTLEFPLDGGQETGSWDVVAMNNGKAFFTTDFLGSGWVPLHELDLATNTIVDRPSSTFSGFNEVGQRTWLYRNANHSVMLGLESNSSAGPVFSYFADTDSFIAGAELGFYPGQTPRSIFHNNGSGSISRDGQWLAIEIERPHVPNEVWILDLALSNIATKLSGIEGGVIFDPYQDLLYGLDTVNDEIIVFDTNSWSEIERIDVCEDLLATQAFDEGVLSFDPLNSTVYVSVSGGILSIKIEFTVSTEDFNDGNYDGWTLIDQGTLAGPMAWSAASGVMVQSSNVHSSISVDPIAKLGTYAYWQTGIGWTDYTAKVTIKSDDNDAIGIMFRYQDENNYYRFIWDQERNSRQLVKCEGGVFSILAEDSVPYVTGKEYQVKISVQGNLLQVSIDGSPVFSVTDSTFSSGTIALYSWGNTGSYFDDIFVDGLP
ncbi:MAG: DUF1080 domain-containing protein, partial [Planctomycetes bacterium]|nr:DUF1080 domain-containing protein [Planctomycetota bacterium]